uniref:Uncharacterized protein n=1 Tax=Amphora coffeiformis TaxID=265554 RepID=A0A7S3L5G7_9STRA|mmetsp:Transcript_24070/g.45744  ORF Transcript_24070/g.45744 Transcript_24070/m.45744 type:complete len:334 (-) Transcript_24070:139-1140(-)|eukprot:scaffold3337_cov169-Amphora_coffeaeformis.AAC.15
MARLFAGKKETKDQHIDVNFNKKRFGLFRRGNSEKAIVVTPPEPERVSPDRKTKSYRISVYEVRNDSPTPTCTSSTEEENLREERGRFQRWTGSPSKRQTGDVSRHRDRSPTKRRRSTSPPRGRKIDTSNSDSTTRRTPGRTFSDTLAVKQARSESLSPQRGILKRATFSMGNKSPPKPKPQAIASFDLEVARATSLTDNMSTESSKDRQVNVGGPADDYPLDESNSFVISPKRGVSFSEDTMGPKPKPTGLASLCPGTRSGKRALPRRQGDFSLTHEFEDLCYDLTYFCRCIGEVMTQDEKEKRIQHYVPDDDQTYDSSTFEPSLDRSEGSI